MSQVLGNQTLLPFLDLYIAKEKTNIFHEMDDLTRITADTTSDNLEQKEIIDYSEFASSAIESQVSGHFLPLRFTTIEKSRYIISSEEPRPINNVHASGKSVNNILKHSGAKKENFAPGKYGTFISLQEYNNLSQNQKDY